MARIRAVNRISVSGTLKDKEWNVEAIGMSQKSPLFPNPPPEQQAMISNLLAVYGDPLQWVFCIAGSHAAISGVCAQA